MWRQFKNLLLTLKTYPDLSPDLWIRRQVNQTLRKRPALTLQEWYEYFWQPRGISLQVVSFIYTHMEKHSGLQFARVLPSDRLEDDLKMTLICWFDWQLTFCEDVWDRFKIEIDPFDLQGLTTVEEFVVFLNRQLLPVTQSS